VNSAADERDPAPVPGSRALVFASNRARPDLDLYLATPDASGFLQVDPLERLNGPFDEREPAFASDGRVLYFSSDRDGEDALLRSLLLGDGWSAPRVPGGLCARGGRCV
jgi:Tol biopolymer transport system component